MTDSVTTTPPSSQAFLDPIPRILNHASLNYMSGASGVGKTIILAEWCARLRDGRSICGHLTNPPSEICIIAADRDWSTYAQAFRHASFEDVRRYVLAEDKDFRPKDWKRTEALQLFDRCLNLLNPKPGALVIIDPVSPLFIQGKINDAWDVAVSCHFYRQQARARDITLLCTANVSKQRTEDQYVRPQDRIAGSGAFVAYADTQIYLEQNDKKILTLGWVPRVHEPEEFLFQFDKVTCLYVPYKPEKSKEELPENRLAVLQLVPDEGITSPELVRKAVEAGVSRATTFRALRDLEDLQLISRSRDGFISKRDLSDKPPS